MYILSLNIFEQIYNLNKFIIGGLVVKDLACQSTGDDGSSMGWENPLKEEMATHSWSVFLPGSPHGQRCLAGCGVSKD